MSGLDLAISGLEARGFASSLQRFDVEDNPWSCRIVSRPSATHDTYHTAHGQTAEDAASMALSWVAEMIDS